MPDPIDWGHAAPYLLAALGFGYLLGSIPFGLIVSRLAGHGDIRTIGSGNIGATNALRTGSKGVALATFLGDMGKGLVAVLIARQWGPDTAVMAALGAFLGHLYPVWLGFKGGKGISTFIGVLLGLNWLAALFFCAVWLATATALRFSSLAALVAAALTPAYLAYAGEWQKAELALALAVLAYIAHRANIARLIKGEEPRIGSKSDGPSPENA